MYYIIQRKTFTDIKIDKKWLYDQYIIKRKGVMKIARSLCVNKKYISRALKYFDIPQFIGRNFIGHRFDKIIVTEMVFEKRKVRWKCLCDCGNYRTVRSDYFKYIKSCGHCGDTENISRAIWNRYRVNAKVRKISFKVSNQYLYDLYTAQNKRCVLTGWEIYIAKDSKARNQGGWTASIDRIDSKKGYVAGNVQWIHKNVNKMKWAFEQGYFIKMCKLVKKYNS